MTIDKEFVTQFLLTRHGRLNPGALKKYNISKEQAFLTYNNLPSPHVCNQCGVPTSLISFNKGYAEFCSVKCASSNTDVIARRHSTVLDNYGQTGYGSPTITGRKQQTSRTNYGTDHARQLPKHVSDQKDKWQQQFGVTSFSHSESAIQKRNNTNLEKYGSVNPAQNSAVREKTKNTNLDRYGVESVLMLHNNRHAAVAAKTSSDCYNKLNDINWLIDNKNVSSVVLSQQLDVAFSTILNYYKKHNVTRDSIISSAGEHQIIEFLKQHNITVEQHNRTILNGKEIDIFLPDHQIGIEYNGLYWHSEKFLQDRLYHYNKTTCAREKNVQLIHITDWEWNNKSELVKRRLLSKLGISDRIHARKCSLRELTNLEYKTFVESHHIQGYAPSKVRLGLVYGNDVVATMSFSKPRYNKKYEWELIRYASTGTVVGGASKLFKHFVKNYKPTSIISYSDLRWNTGKLYTTLGMELSHTSSPNYWYIVDGAMQHRSRYQKHKLHSVLDMFDPLLTEWENMQANGYTRFWDCGNNVYTIQLTGN